MSTDQDGITGGAVQPQSGAPATQVPETAQIAPSDRKIGVSGHVEVAHQLIGCRSSRIAELGGTVAALTIKLADAEERLDRQDRQIAGAGERNSRLKARMKALRIGRDREARERVRAQEEASKVPALHVQLERLREQVNSNAAKLADMTTNRDALDEICERKDKRIEVAEADQSATASRERYWKSRCEEAETNFAAYRKESQKPPSAEIRAVEIERDTARDIAALFRETIEEARRQLEYLDGRWSTGTTPAIIAKIDAVLETVPPEPKRNAVESAAYLALGTWLAWPDAGRDGPREVNEGQVLSWLSGLPNALARAKVADNSRPRCRVVTSPRFYGEAEIERAAEAIGDLDPSQWGWTEAIVEVVATGLGMRRAAK